MPERAAPSAPWPIPTADLASSPAGGAAAADFGSPSTLHTRTAAYLKCGRLLIGSDVRIGLNGHQDSVIVMGRPELTRLYAAAVDEAGKQPIELDGEQSFLAGAIKIAEMI